MLAEVTFDTTLELVSRSRVRNTEGKRDVLKLLLLLWLKGARICRHDRVNAGDGDGY
jgi:hypothetical protein